MTEVNVLTATEMVEQCKIPVAIATAVITVIIVPVKMIAMFVLFTKIDKAWGPDRLAAKLRHREKIGRQMKRQVW